jgi:hypothetical protein
LDLNLSGPRVAHARLRLDRSRTQPRGALDQPPAAASLDHHYIQGPVARIGVDFRAGSEGPGAGNGRLPGGACVNELAIAEDPALHGLGGSGRAQGSDGVCHRAQDALQPLRPLRRHGREANAGGVDKRAFIHPAKVEGPRQLPLQGQSARGLNLQRELEGAGKVVGRSDWDHGQREPRRAGAHRHRGNRSVSTGHGDAIDVLIDRLRRPVQAQLHHVRSAGSEQARHLARLSATRLRVREQRDLEPRRSRQRRTCAGAGPP